MKVHLMAAIDGSKDDYRKIIHAIEKSGHSLVTNHLLDRKIEDIENESADEAELAAKKIQQWIKKADVIIYEVTKPDVSIGFEVASALHLGKPVVVLYRSDNGSVPHGLKGISSDKLQVLSYDHNTLEELIKLSLEYAQETNDTRFNFFISPNLSHYLDWVSQTMKIPRSVYLRKLIEDDRESHSEYFQQ